MTGVQFKLQYNDEYKTKAQILIEVDDHVYFCYDNGYSSEESIAEFFRIARERLELFCPDTSFYTVLEEIAVL